jgi:hypothetical protein
MNQARESSRRLADLLHRERGAMTDFLLALAEFDRSRLWVQLGHANLFDFLHRELGLSRGAAHYRKVAAHLVQRYPEMVEPLRAGKLCITVVLELARVITPENSAIVLPQFFHRSKQEAKAIAVAICPAAVIPRREVVTGLPQVSSPRSGRVQPVELAASESVHRAAGPGTTPATPMQLEPLTPDLRRLHMTVSKQFIDKLEAARKGQGHAQPGASAEKVIEAALDLFLAQQAKRRGEVKKPQQNPRPSKNPGHVPAAVRREVWSRDEGKCTWPLDSGGICGSTLRLEIDHVVPRGRGGASTVDGCRLLCAAHNQLAARQVYGDEWMDQVTRGDIRDVPLARDPVAPWVWTARLTSPRFAPARSAARCRAGAAPSAPPGAGDPSSPSRTGPPPCRPPPGPSP